MRPCNSVDPTAWRHTPAVAAAPAFAVAGSIDGLAPFRHPSIPDDLHAGIAGKGAGQQLEGGKVATPHDDESWVAHWRGRLSWTWRPRQPSSDTSLRR